jgi:heptosyltransferase-2
MMADLLSAPGPKNILVVSVNWLGDVVFSTPVYRALKDNYPGVHITALAVPRVRDVLALCPDVDDVIVYDEDGEDRPLLAKWRVALQVQARHFDMAFILRPSVSRAWLAWSAGIPLRVGFKTKNKFGLINVPMDDQGLDVLHRADVYLALLERGGLTVRDRACRLALPDASLAAADSLLAAHGIVPGESFIVLNTGGNWGLKQWPWEHFSALARAVVKEKKMKVVFSGALADSERVARVAASSGVPVVQLAGATTMAGLAAVFARSAGVVSSDSGPLHLAAALGVRTIALFGATRPEITGPRGTAAGSVLFRDVGCNKAPCYYLECSDNRCMKAVEVRDVIAIL